MWPSTWKHRSWLSTDFAGLTSSTPCTKHQHCKRSSTRKTNLASVGLLILEDISKKRLKVAVFNVTDCSQHHQLLYGIQKASRNRKEPEVEFTNLAAPHSLLTFGTATCSTCPSIPRLFEAESCCQRGAKEQKKPHLLVLQKRRSNMSMDLSNPRPASRSVFQVLWVLCPFSAYHLDRLFLTLLKCGWVPNPETISYHVYFVKISNFCFIFWVSFPHL